MAKAGLVSAVSALVLLLSIRPVFGTEHVAPATFLDSLEDDASDVKEAIGGWYSDVTGAVASLPSYTGVDAAAPKAYEAMASLASNAGLDDIAPSVKEAMASMASNAGEAAQNAKDTGSSWAEWIKQKFSGFFSSGPQKPARRAGPAPAPAPTPVAYYY